MRIDNILNKDNNISYLQKKCITELSNIFDKSSIQNFSYDCYYHDGTFGKYQGRLVYTIYIKFSLNSNNFEFIVAYNQLEYYIHRDDNIIAECNLEDFWDEDSFLEKYFSFLETDLKRINI